MSLVTSSVPSTRQEWYVRVKSTRSTPTFCAEKLNGKWRIVHAYNKLNAVTIPAQPPISLKDVLQNNMAGCTIAHLTWSMDSTNCSYDPLNPAYSSENSEWYVMEMAGDAPRAV